MKLLAAFLGVVIVVIGAIAAILISTAPFIVCAVAVKLLFF